MDGYPQRRLPKLPPIECSNTNCPKREGGESFESSFPLFTCSGCWGAVFCNDECQRQRWDAHSQACNYHLKKKEDGPEIPKLEEGVFRLVRTFSTTGNCYRNILKDETHEILRYTSPDDPSTVGKIKVTIVPPEAAVDEEDCYFDILDERSRELGAFAYRCVTNKPSLKREILYGGDPPVRRFNGNDARYFALLDEIEIHDPEWRGRGLGTRFLKLFLSRLHEARQSMKLCVTQPSLLTFCDPILRREANNPFNPPPRTNEEQEELKKREELVFKFYRKLGFRRMGNTKFFGYGFSDDHPSRQLDPNDDPPYQDALPPSNRQEMDRLMMVDPHAFLASRLGAF